MIEQELNKISDEDLKKLYNERIKKYGDLGTQYYSIEEQILSNRLDIDQLFKELKKRNIELK